MPSTDDGDYGLLSPLWAGTSVAAVTSDRAVLDAIVRFEVALAEATAPDGVASRIFAAASSLDPAAIALAARAGGNPVIPVLAALRSSLDGEASHWLHRGATSQDALDTALALVARDAAALIVGDATRAVIALTEPALDNAETVITGRTLTQPSTPTTLGVKIAGWMWSIARAAAALRAAADALPVQLGGASGTLASFTASGVDPLVLTSRLAADLGLDDPVAPWHVHRSAITRLGDALVELCDAYGTVGRNVAALARLGEVDDGASGGSSTMPQKSNPVSAVLLTSGALQAPHLGATLHAAASTVDERPDGAWHAEWSALRDLLRVAGGAAAAGAELAVGLRIHPDVIAANVARHADDLLAERARFAEGPATPADYIGIAPELARRLVGAAHAELE